MFLINTFNLSKRCGGSLLNFVLSLGTEWSTKFEKKYLENPKNQVALGKIDELYSHINTLYIFRNLQYAEAGFAIGFVCGQIFKPKDDKILKIIDQIKKRLEGAELIPKHVVISKVQRRRLKAGKESDHEKY